MMEYINIGCILLVATAGLVFLINNISSKHVRSSMKALILYFWTTSFLPLLLVPLDFSLFNAPDEQKVALSVLWKIYYFLNLFNGQLMLPFIIAYVGSGWVTPRSRATDAAGQVFFWLGLKLAGLAIGIALGFLIAIYFFGVQTDVFHILKTNSINWLNTA